jgi:hypothetical protein
MTNEPRWSAQELRIALNSYEAELRVAGKARNTIKTYVQHPEPFINWLERKYSGGSNSGSGGGGGPGPGAGRSGMPWGRSRYDPLKRYLAERSDPVVSLSFVDIERIMGGPLPPSARRHRPWWANERAGSHLHASAWMSIGRRTANVDLNAGTVDFVR